MPELAKEVEDLIKHGSYSLPVEWGLEIETFYKELAATYLPKLRKVQYTYGYSIFRSLTDDEIRRIFTERIQRQLTRFEYLPYDYDSKTPDEREKYCGSS